MSFHQVPIGLKNKGWLEPGALRLLLAGTDHRPDPAYIAALHDLPCIVCTSHGEQQLSGTTAHHVIHGRAAVWGNRKTPDRCAIPLCDGHHQGAFDNSKLAIHQHQNAWGLRYGADFDFTPRVQDIMSARRFSI